MSDYGKETIVFFEIDQPLCSRTYGDGLGSPTPSSGCQALLGASGTVGSPPTTVLGGPNKCFNTRFTCQDSANYNPGTLTLRFAMGQRDLLQYGYVIPSLVSVRTTPSQINLAAMDSNISALGQREVVTLRFDDHLHSDMLVDKYRLERKNGLASASGSPGDAYDPYARGTFWGKWLARNPYFSGYVCRLREGFLGDALEDMRIRYYVIDRIDGPSEGQITLVAKDIFSKIETRKSVAPIASQGELLADISAGAGTATLSPSGIGALEYPASGHVAIGDECLAFTRSGDVLTLTERGSLNTAAAEHKQEDLVQLVLSYVAQLSHDIVYDLLTTYSAVPAANIPKTTWDVLSADITTLFTGRIVTPTPVSVLVGELCEQAGFTIWPDVSTNEIRYAALRPSAASVTVDDRAWIKDGSLSIKRQIERRVSQCWVYYGQVNPTKDIEDRQNFRSRLVVEDADAEDSTQYGVPSIREVFSRWIPQFGRQAATDLGERIISMFRDPPLESRFDIHASRDGDLDIAAPFSLQVAELQDASGAELAVTHVPVAIQRGENEFSVVAQQATFSSGSGASATDRTIYIENDSVNLNLRTVHDSIYAAPGAGVTVNFIVIAGVKVGSTSTSLPAMRTGSWPDGVTVTLTVNGRIQGKGGAGAMGVRAHGGGDPEDVGLPGLIGGNALQVDSAISVDNQGEIWAGGGGGGSAGHASVSSSNYLYLSPAGGGGAGDDPGAGGFSETYPGNPGTTEAGGAAKIGNGADGDGGAGGGPGLDGGAGTMSATGLDGGAGGVKGYYVVGNTLVTWVNNGDRRGAVS